jgi:hypothetical protein
LISVYYSRLYQRHRCIATAHAEQTNFAELPE